MKTKVLGLPRIGQKRGLKKVLESYWKGKATIPEVIQTGQAIKKENWELLKTEGIGFIPSNDFSFYD